MIRPCHRFVFACALAIFAKAGVASNGWDIVDPGSGGISGSISAFARKDSLLYAVGNFTWIGESKTQGVAVWDGKKWSGLGSGLNGPARVLHVDSAGNLFVGGLFDSAGGIAARNVAMWNGTEWHSLGVGVENGIPASSQDVIRGIARTKDGMVVVGGSFAGAGAAKISFLAGFKDGKWLALGVGPKAAIQSMGLGPDGRLYLATAYRIIAHFASDRLLSWDGSELKELGSGNTSEVSVYSSVAFDRDSSACFAGSFYALLPSGSTTKNFACWKNGNWKSLGADLDGKSTALGMDTSGRILLAGRFSSAGGVRTGLLARWNSKTWESLHPWFDTTGSALQINAIAQDRQGRYWIGFEGGASAFADGSHGAAAMIGNEWRPLGKGMNGAIRKVSIAPGGGIVAMGDFHRVDRFATRGLARFANGEWTSLLDSSRGTLMSMELDPSGNPVVVGNFTKLQNVNANGVARYRQGKWEAVGGGLTGGPIGSVSKIAINEHGTISCLGTFDSANGKPLVNPYSAFFDPDSSAWRSITGMDSAIILGVQPVGSHFAIIGHASGRSSVYEGNAEGFKAISGAGDKPSDLWGDVQGNLAYSSYSLKKILLRQETEFVPIDPPIGTIKCATFDSKGAFVVGIEVKTDSTSQGEIQRWNGTGWERIGERLSAPPTTITYDPVSDLLYVGSNVPLRSGDQSPGYLARTPFVASTRVGFPRDRVANGFEGAGLGLRAARAGRLIVRSLDGKTEFSKDVDQGERIAEAIRTKGLHLVTIGAETRWILIPTARIPSRN